MTLLDDDEYPFPKFTVTESTVRPYPIMVIKYDGPKNNLLVKAEPADGYKFKIENHIAYFKPKDQEYTGGRKVGDVIVFELLHVLEVGNAEGEPVQIDFSLYLIEGPTATLLSRKRSPPIIVFNHSQYLPAPSITKLLPSWAPAGAAPKIDAFGPLFLRKNNILECQVAELDGRQCRMFAGNDIVRKRNNFHSFSFSAPPHAAGTVMVRARYKGRDFGGHRTFDYIQPPTLHIRGSAVGHDSGPGSSGGSGGAVAVPSRVLLAAYTGQLEVLKSILAADKQAPHERDQYGFTALMWASLSGIVEAVDLLLDAGADVNAVNKRGETALHMACYAANHTVVQSLVTRGAFSSIRGRIDGFLPIHVASFVGPVDSLRMIIEDADNDEDALQDVQLAARDRDGMTPLHLAVIGNRLDNVQLLVEAYINEGIELTLKDAAGMTAFMWAVSLNNYEISRAILNGVSAECGQQEKRDLVNVRNGDGETALFLAVRHADNALTQLLLDSGAEVGIKNHRGQLPFECLGDIDVAPVYKARPHVVHATGPKMNASDVDELSGSAKGEIVPFEITDHYGVQMLEHVAKVKSNKVAQVATASVASLAASSSSSVSAAMVQIALEDDDCDVDEFDADLEDLPTAGSTPAPTVVTAALQSVSTPKPAPSLVTSGNRQTKMSISMIARETEDTPGNPASISSETPGNPAKASDGLIELQVINSDLARKLRVMQELMEEKDRTHREKVNKYEAEIESLRAAVAAVTARVS
jgi:ankyrin repeat protein